MNRHALAEASSLHDGPVPVYLMGEIANSTKASDRDAEKTADYILRRLNKSNLNVKLKALQIIAFCIREGSPTFSDAIREEEQEILAYIQFSGPPDPVYGDEKYRRIRVAAQEALVCLNDGFLSSQKVESPQLEQETPQCASRPWQAQEGESAQSYNHSNGVYNQGQSERQLSSVGGSWGQPLGSSRPTPYQDNPSVGYNNAAACYNGPAGGGYNAPSPGLNGRSRNFQAPSEAGNGHMGKSLHGSNESYGQNIENSGCYEYNQAGTSSVNTPNIPQQQPSGFNSWAASAGTGLTTKTAGAGVWSSSGYQKKDSASDNEPRYNPSTLRDNRPTVLVGHTLSFPKPAVGFGRSNASAPSGLGGFESGTYNPNAVRSAVAENSFNGGNNARSNFGGGYQSGGPPSYMDNASRPAHRIGSLGLPVNGQPLNNVPTTALGKKAEVLKKMGTAALEKWDRRNMDKSMASSLADNDELRAGPQVIDHGFFQLNGQQGTGGGDTSRDYERTMIDSLCASAGLSRAPSADDLKRFLDLAQTLDAQTIGDILLDKLEDDTWQVRLKGLHVVLGLLDSPGAKLYQEFFEANLEVIKELRKDVKPSVVSKTLQLLRALGHADKAIRAPPSGARCSNSTQTQRGSPITKTHHEVDLLGLSSLSLESAPGPTNKRVINTLDLLGSANHPQLPPPPAHRQEVSLLDGFDAVKSSRSSDQTSYCPSLQQHYQQPLQDKHKTFGHFGKELYAVTNSPRGASMVVAAQPHGTCDDRRLGGGQSAFNFM